MELSKFLWGAPRENQPEPLREAANHAQATEDAHAVLLKRAGGLLSMFEGNSRHSWLEEYRRALADCTGAYSRIRQLRPEYKKQSIVLESYFQKDKLRGYMEQLVAFAQAEPRPTDTAEKLAVKGYSNYLFVIRCSMKDMAEKLREYVPEEPGAELTVRLFLQQESTGQPILEQWQQLRSRISMTFKNPAATRMEYAQRMSELDEIEISFQKNRDAVTAFLRKKQAALLQRGEKMAEEIQMGEALSRALTQLLTEELFDRFDPDSTQELEQDILLVRGSYRELAGQLQQLLEAFPRR